MPTLSEAHELLALPFEPAVVLAPAHQIQGTRCNRDGKGVEVVGLFFGNDDNIMTRKERVLHNRDVKAERRQEAKERAKWEAKHAKETRSERRKRERREEARWERKHGR